MSFQDWDPMVLKKTNTQLKKEGNVTTETVIKKKHFDANAKKIEETEIGKLDKIPRDVALTIQKARLAKKLSQDDLAKMLNLKKSVINEIETCKYKYDKQLISKLKRKLGIN